MWRGLASASLFMLILIDSALLDPKAHSKLFHFLRCPYTVESCEWVDQVLPDAASAYRSMADSRGHWAAATQANLVSLAMQILMPVGGLEARKLPIVSSELAMAQIILLQENLRDHQERLERSGCAEQAHEGSIKSGAYALQGAALHEAVFLTMIGLFTIRRQRQLLAFDLSASGRASLRNRSLGFVLNAQSRMALQLSLQQLIQRLNQRAPASTSSIVSMLSRDSLNCVVMRLLDSQFSFDSTMQAAPKMSSLLQGAKSLCRWFALLEVVRLAGEDAYHPRPEDIARLELDLDLLQDILLKQSTALQSDRGIYQTSSGGLTLGGASLEHAITCCKYIVLDEVACGAIGMLFEEFVHLFIKERVPASDYIVCRGIESSGSDRGKPYECDLILFEPGRRKLFFIQLKWKRDSRTSNLDDEFHNWRGKNSALVKAVSQLTFLRERLHETKVIDQVRNELGRIQLSKEEIVKNAHFIVVHTMPEFSAYSREGVAIYEWNLFRNLLRRGAIQKSHAAQRDTSFSDVSQEVSHESTLPLEEPDRILMYYAEMLGLDAERYEMLTAAREEARYGFDIALEESPFWRRLMGLGTMRVVRPYL